MRGRGGPGSRTGSPETAVGARLVYTGSARSTDGRWSELHVDQRDERTGLAARTTFRSVDEVAACQITTTVTNHGQESLLLQGLTSFAAYFGTARPEDVDLLRADSEWLGEGRWFRHPLRDGALPDLNLGLHGQDGRGRFAVVSTGTWSTGTHLPTGGLVDRRTGQAWLWQVEHNGAWRWEVGERLDGVYVALLGPTDIDHQWQHCLLPGESFTSVPVSVAVAGSGVDGAIAALTGAPPRDRAAAPRPDRVAGGVQRLHEHADGRPDHGEAAAADRRGRRRRRGGVLHRRRLVRQRRRAGGTASASGSRRTTRFPRGIEEVHRPHPRARHGARSVAGARGDRRAQPDGRPAARTRRSCSAAVSGSSSTAATTWTCATRGPSRTSTPWSTGWSSELGVGYFKLDYNIDPGAGTDVAADSAGAGLLAHNRAHLAWLDGVLDRHPRLILENCASGAMRMDYAMLSRMQLQSTSDQQDPLRYPPIAVAAPMSVLPEQSASWAYPQPDMSDEEIAFTLCTGMLGRLYLSGPARPDDGGAARLGAGRGARCTRRSAPTSPTAVPLWPLGLPGWSDPWLSLALTLR